MRFDELSRNFGKKLTDAGDVAVKKTKEAAEILKNKGIIADEKRKLRNLYREVGRRFYEDCAAKNELPEEYASLFSAIAAGKEKIAEREAAIGVINCRKTCSKCGGELPEDAAFCPKCGAAVEEEAEETEVTKNDATVLPSDILVETEEKKDGETSDFSDCSNSSEL